VITAYVSIVRVIDLVDDKDERDRRFTAQTLVSKKVIDEPSLCDFPATKIDADECNKDEK
jgi:hypothetical protein